MLQAVLASFGLSVNPRKSTFTPRPWFEHLGLIVDLRKHLFDVPEAKRLKLRGVAR